MSAVLKSVDISEIRDPLTLARLAEEVRDSREPRILKRENEELAILMPITTSSTQPRMSTEEDREAFLSAAGSWADVDTDALIEQIYESRRSSSRPPVEL